MRGLALGVLVFVVAMGGTSYAQPEPATPPASGEPVPTDPPTDAPTEQQKRDQAREHYLAGKLHHDAGRYDEAAQEYQAAYELSEVPVLLYNLAQAHRLAQRKAEALKLYKQYVALEPDGAGADNARELIAALEKQLAEQAAAAHDSQATGAPAEPPAIVTPDPEVSDAPLPPISVFPSAGRTKRIVGAVIAGVGLVAVGVGITYGIDAHDKNGDVSGLSGVWDPADQAIWDAGNKAERRMMLLTGIGAAAVTGGAVLYFLGVREGTRESQPPIAISPTVGGAQVTFSARF